MTDAVLKMRNPATQEIVVEETFPHAPEIIWKTLTTGALIGRWLMTPIGFEAVKGNRFTFQTKAAGAWDGIIHCEVLEAIPNERLAYAWKGGHEGNVGYGAPLGAPSSPSRWPRRRTARACAWSMPASSCRGTKSALQTMGDGWKKVVRTLGQHRRRAGPPRRNRTDAQDRRATMSKAYTGGCACGAVRYEISGEPMFSNDCQCRDCQHKSGTGHGSYLTFAVAQARDAHRQGDALGHGRRQRQREDARLLPHLRLAGLSDVRGHARPVHHPRREPRRSQPLPAASGDLARARPRLGPASIRPCRHSTRCRRCPERHSKTGGSMAA